MTITALIVDTAAPAGPRKLTPAQPTGDNAGAERCSPPACSDRTRQAPGMVAEAIRATVARFGAGGCALRMAQESGDHPEAAAERMRWVRSVLGLTRS
jgi:hypothetical protein